MSAVEQFNQLAAEIGSLQLREGQLKAGIHQAFQSLCAEQVGIDSRRLWLLGDVGDLRMQSESSAWVWAVKELVEAILWVLFCGEGLMCSVGATCMEHQRLLCWL